MSLSEFLVKFQDLLQREEAVTLDMQLADIEEWDSLAMLSTIAFFDKEFAKQLTFVEMNNFDTVSELLELAGIQ